MQLRNLVFSSFALLTSVYASNVLDLTPDNFDKNVLDSGRPSLVEFFAPWCGHCKKLAPIYEELADSFASGPGAGKVNIAKVDADDHKSLGTKYGISGFPTIKYFDGKSKDPEDYSGGRDLESLQEFVEKKAGAKAKKAAKAPSSVEMLTDKTFGGAVGKDKDVFVAFTAPWCGHCKSLAPTWEKLASDLSPDSDTVTIAKVDAEANRDVADKYGVKGYPTIKYFPAGDKEALDYSGGRDEKTLLEYVNEHAGTHRIVGGGLDKTAGTVAALDSIVKNVSGGSGDLETVKKDMQKAVKDAKDKYAEYYSKAVDKLSSNKNYLEKERSRLEGILKKGGLARAKEDDVTARLNILNRFGLRDEENKENIKEEL